MAWWQSLDAGLVHFINLQWEHPVLVAVMKFLSGNALFIPAVIALGALLLWKGGVRGRVFVVVLAVVLALGDTFVISMLKKAVARPRPFMAMADLHVPVGRGSGIGSMPSGHASIWFAATLVTFIYYRRSWRVLLPLACAVSFSRLYLGVHYPSDVLAGAVLGAGYATAGLVLLNAVWQRVGKAWFPLWWAEFPSLLRPGAQLSPQKKAAIDSRPAAVEQHWLRFGYVTLALVLVGRLVYVASGTIDLSEDEAYQWLWSKHLALSYYSKPPLIAYTQWLGTSLWGDTELGVRFFSPLIGVGVALLTLRFMARIAGARAAAALVLILLATPLLAVGSTLLTIDPLLVLFWTLAVLWGWRAVQPDATVWHWLGVGLAAGLAFLSKYSATYLIVCWALFFTLCPAARVHLRRPGPYLAILVNGLCTLPVILWNAQHSWITVSHLSERSGLRSEWKPTLRFFGEFAGAELGLLNPIFFVAALWAMAVFWRSEKSAVRETERPTWPDRRSLLIYLFCMGPTVFLGHWLYTLYARVLPNWIAPAVVPLFCLMVLYWEPRWRRGERAVKDWLTAGLVVGFVILAFLHEPRLIDKLTRVPLPADKDPLRRTRAWPQTAEVVNAARRQLQAEGKPTFIIAPHYGLVGELSFYVPEAQTDVRTTPLVFYLTSSRPRNQFYFWPHYRYRETRKGQNAIYVSQAGRLRYSTKQWFRALFTGAPPPEPEVPQPEAPPALLLEEFTSVKDLGVRPVYRRGQVYRWVQLFECRDLR
jgi:4-amino-4-deoxy-L-arabinose transferase-like glycosyltransferase/membrane-associated phospholipid phosphatase